MTNPDLSALVEKYLAEAYKSDPALPVVEQTRKLLTRIARDAYKLGMKVKQ